MAIIEYVFADGHKEKIEVSETFKHEYEFLSIQERAKYWKIKKQKQRAKLEVKYDLSLEQLYENGFEPPASTIDPLDYVIQKEKETRYYQRMFSNLTEKQKEAYVLHYIKGIPNMQIAELLHIDESSVRERLFWAQKKILKNFLSIPPNLK